MKAVVFVNDQRMEIIIQRLRSAGVQVQEGRCEKDMEQIERMAGRIDLVICRFRASVTMGLSN